MSVINKMLRDLDDRVRSGTAAAGYDAALPPSLTHGTSSVSLPLVPVRALRAQAARRRWVLAWVLGLGVVALLGWLAAQSLLDSAIASAAKPRGPASAQSITADSPLYAAAATAAHGFETGPQDPGPRESASSASPRRRPPAEQAVTASVAVTRERTRRKATSVAKDPGNKVSAPALAAPATAAAAHSGAAPEQVPASPEDRVAAPSRARARMPSAATPSGQHAVGTASRGATVLAPPPDAMPSADTWHEQAVEVLALAQRRWTGGEASAATAMLRRALAARALRSDQPEGADFRIAQAMVRELVRMESALGNQKQVLAVLRQYEAIVLTQADLWAVRAQAAQRLAQHAQAVQAYRAAMQLRVAEPRWMLGLAVSLAALGQVQEAGHWLARAHAIAPVDREVMEFLAQLQVRLADRSTLEHDEQTVNKR